MSSSSEMWNIILITGIPSLIAGGILGTFFARLLNPSEQENREAIREMEQKSHELEEYLQKSQDNFKVYQGDVEDHFRETADLVVSLTEIYRDIHNHLAEGAQQLCETGAGGPVLTRLTEAGSPVLPLLAETDEDAGEKELAHTPTPPLDYAPKNNRYEKGVLTEDFGLEKHSLEEQDEQDEETSNNTKEATPSPALVD